MRPCALRPGHWHAGIIRKAERCHEPVPSAAPCGPLRPAAAALRGRPCAWTVGLTRESDRLRFEQTPWGFWFSMQIGLGSRGESAGVAWVLCIAICSTESVLAEHEVGAFANILQKLCTGNARDSIPEAWLRPNKPDQASQGWPRPSPQLHPSVLSSLPRCASPCPQVGQYLRV